MNPLLFGSSLALTLTLLSLSALFLYRLIKKNTGGSPAIWGALIATVCIGLLSLNQTVLLSGLRTETFKMTPWLRIIAVLAIVQFGLEYRKVRLSVGESND